MPSGAYRRHANPQSYLKPYLNAGQELNGIIASDVMRPPPACLTPNQRLLDVLPILLASELRNVPVVNSLTEFRLVGAVVLVHDLTEPRNIEAALQDRVTRLVSIGVELEEST